MTFLYRGYQMKVKVAGATRHSKTSYSAPVSQRRSWYGSRLRFSHPHITIQPITAKLDVIHKTGSTPEVSQRRQMRTTGDLHQILGRSFQRFQRYAREQARRHAHRQTNRSQYSALLPGRSKNCPSVLFGL